MASFPPPAGPLNVKAVTWNALSRIERIHPAKYRGDAFNTSDAGDARFSPIRDVVGNIIPTMYGGTTFACAAMETIFRDVPYVPGYKEVLKSSLVGLTYNAAFTTEDLRLADLSGPALRDLGISRADLIDTESDEYPITRQWAEAIHHRHPDIQGLHWVSRQNDNDRCVVIFGDRLDNDRMHCGPETPLINERGDIIMPVLDLAEAMGVHFV